MEYVEKIINIPTHLPVQGQDVFNYLAASYASNHQLHMVLSFNGHIRQDMIAKSIRYTMDIEPVLGCRFVESPKNAYFERRTDLDALKLCPVCEIEQPRDELRKFICQSIDSRKDPLVQAKIFRTHNKDYLCVKMDHTCIDGGGIKEYVYLLSEIYNNFYSHRPQPVLQSLPDRDGGRFLKQFGIDDPRQVWDPSQTGPQPTWSFPATDTYNQHPTFIMRQINKELFRALEGYAKRHTVTINDLLLTAYYRAFFKITNTAANEPRPVLLTVDLRRLMPDSTKITAVNFSSSFNAFLSYIPGESFGDTLGRVAQVMTDLKQSHGEIPIVVILELFGFMDFTEVQGWFGNARQQAIESGFSTPHLSNIGVINPIKFGEYRAIEGYIVTPAMFAPGFMLGASTYDQVLTLVISYYASDINEELVHTFLELMVSDLKECVSF